MTRDWTFDRRADFLTELRASRIGAPQNITPPNTGQTMSAITLPPVDTIEAALCRSAQISSELLEDHFDDDTLRAADRLDGFSVQDAVRAIIQGRTGERVGRINSAHIEASLQPARPGEVRASSGGYSSTTLPGILSNLMNKAILAAYTELSGAALRLASATSTSDFKKYTRFRMTESGVMDEVPATGELPHGELTEEQYENQLKTFAKMYTVSTQMLRNDDIDALLQVPRQLGRMGRHNVERLVLTALIDAPIGTDTGFYQSDGSSGRAPNYAAGASTALSIDSVTQARLLFDNQVDSDNKPIAIEPTLLWVPNQEAVMARKIYRGSEYRLGAGTVADEVIGNPHFNEYEPILSGYTHRLGQTPSTKTWWLAARTDDEAAVNLGYLDDKRAPTVETQAERNPAMGMSVRGYFDIGVALQDPRMIVRMKGEA